MKKIVLLMCFSWMVMMAGAQKREVHRDKKLIYIEHKVGARETLYSLGRLYYLSPKDIAKANRLSADAGLRLGDRIRIPLTKANFVQSKLRSKKNVNPVYYSLRKGDNLYIVRKSFNNVSEKLVKEWNKLSRPVLKPEQDLIIGYVKTNEAAAAEAKSYAANTSNVATTKTNTTSVDTPTTKSMPEVASKKNVAETTATVQDPVFVSLAGSEGAEGAFAASFAASAAGASIRTITGNSATFKSTSGWTDRKYYILVNDIPAETIVRVTANGKSVYAKVLETLPSLRDNKDIICRLSNAAASALGISEPKFAVEISYTE